MPTQTSGFFTQSGTGVMLLPDARVLIAGKDGIYNQVPYHYPEHRVELFSPPYLFKGPRPVIVMAPSSVIYDSAFNVQFDEQITPPSEIGSIVLIRPGAVTHSVNMEQRLVGLAIVTVAPGLVVVLSPPDANIAPPGYYMLFLVSTNGVPSVASFVHVSGD